MCVFVQFIYHFHDRYLLADMICDDGLVEMTYDHTFVFPL